MWRMLQHDEPGDFVVCTGHSHSVRELVEAAFDCLGLDWERHVRFDERYLRPAEVDHLEGDGSKAEDVLGWTPKTDFRSLVEMMVEHDLEMAEREALLVRHGHVVSHPGVAQG
jgi:GDPmannose 4,6-dehydratase